MQSSGQFEESKRAPIPLPVGVPGFDSKYVGMLRSGVKPVEDHFVSHFGRMLDGMLHKRLRCPDVIDDVRQETLVRVLNAVKCKTVRNPASLNSFVGAVCQRVIWEERRAKDHFTTGPDAELDRIDAAADPHREFLESQRRRCVASVLAQLSPTDRLVLRLTFLEEESRT